jgi:large subunit ribosomal protein L17
MITLGKRGTLSAYRRANAFMLKPAVTESVFQTFAERYRVRPGGYTRIHKFGNRPGDNAPNAILELVDNPKDLKFAMTARAIGWDLLSRKLKTESPQDLVNRGVPEVHDSIKTVQEGASTSNTALRPRTQLNIQKTLRYRSTDASNELVEKAEDHIVRIFNCHLQMVV